MKSINRIFAGLIEEINKVTPAMIKKADKELLNPLNKGEIAIFTANLQLKKLVVASWNCTQIYWQLGVQMPMKPELEKIIPSIRTEMRKKMLGLEALIELLVIDRKSVV